MRGLRVDVDWQAIRLRLVRVDRLAFKCCILIFLLGSSLVPALSAQSLARVLGIASSITLTIFAAMYLFSRK